MELKEVVVRLKEELKELEYKMNKVQKFMETENFKKLSDENQMLLATQFHCMRSYQYILQRRIKINS